MSLSRINKSKVTKVKSYIEILIKIKVRSNVNTERKKVITSQALKLGIFGSRRNAKIRSKPVKPNKLIKITELLQILLIISPFLIVVNIFNNKKAKNKDNKLTRNPKNQSKLHLLSKNNNKRK